MSNREQRDDRLAAMLENRLVKGEEVLHVSHISSGIYWTTIAVVVLALLVGTFVASRLGLFFLGVAGLMAVYAALRQSFLLLVLTNKRILARSGILKVDVVDIRFDKIESLELEQMLPGFLMGYANLVVMGTGNRYIVVPYVANAAKIRKSFNEITIGE